MQPLTAHRLWELPRVGAPAVAGAGRLVVPVTTNDVAANEAKSRLWLIGDREKRPLTPEELNASKPVVSPDRQQIAFIAPVDGQKQLHLLGLDGDDPVAVTDLPLGTLGAKWLPNGQGLVILAYLFNGHLTPEETSEEMKRRTEAKFVVHATELATYRYWDTWLTTGEVPHLFIFDIETSELTDLMPKATRWWAWPSTDDPWDCFDISPDSRFVAFSADASLPPHRQLRHSIFEIEIESGTETELTPEAPAHATRPRYSPGGDALLYGQQLLAGFYGDRVRLVIHPRATDLHRVITEDLDRSAEGWEFDGHGDIVFFAEDQARTTLYRLTERGPYPLTTGGTLASPVIDDHGTVFLLRHSLQQPPEVVRLDSNDTLSAVTNFDDVKDVDWGAVEDHTLPGADAEPIQFFLIHPPGADPTARLPLLHLIHGGPHACFGDSWQWRWQAQIFAGMGYRVALVNYHGSTSFGQKYTESILGAWGDKPYRDLEAVTDHLIGAGLVVETAMGLAGGSYGGYLAAFVTSQTDRYACAVVHAGVTNFGGTYASDLTSGRPQSFGAEIFEDRAQVDLYSPSSHASGYNTPTLVIHGERDYRVPHTQGLELYGVLKAKGVPARLLYFPAENHWILAPQASLYWYEEVEKWLNLYLK